MKILREKILSTKHQWLGWLISDHNKNLEKYLAECNGKTFCCSMCGIIEKKNPKT